MKRKENHRRESPCWRKNIWHKYKRGKGVQREIPVKVIFFWIFCESSVTIEITMAEKEC